MIIGSVDKTAETQVGFALTFYYKNYIINKKKQGKETEHFFGSR